MPGRIDSYIHSDSSTKNKGGCLVKVSSETDFGARTSIFIEFCKQCAVLCFGSAQSDWDGLVGVFPDIADEKEALEAELKEKVVLEEVLLLHL